MNLNLKIDKIYKPYIVSRKAKFDGIHYAVHFPNGYGASIIKNKYSYGYEYDLWELALIMKRGDEWHLEYRGIVLYDVLGYLTDEKVNIILSKIMKGEIN